MILPFTWFISRRGRMSGLRAGDVGIGGVVESIISFTEVAPACSKESALVNELNNRRYSPRSGSYCSLQTGRESVLANLL